METSDPSDVSGPLGDLALKRLRPILSGIDMRRFEVHIVYQQAGEMVLTPPGFVYHWTTSVGFTVAEALNYFVERDCESAQQRLDAFLCTLPSAWRDTALTRMLKNNIAAVA